VAEIRTHAPSVLAVLASPDACDHVSDLANAGRVAPDEVVLVGDVSITAIDRAVRLVDPDAVVMAVSDGWAGIVVEGEGARDVFARVSELVLPAFGFVQGDVAGTRARVFVDGERVELLVPAMVADHVRALIEAEVRR
jgi:sarcosine oxidase gamma subunit